MVHTHDNKGAPGSVEAALADLAQALTRDVPSLEAGLDVTFEELRAARMAISAPWSSEAVVEPLDVGGLPRKVAELITGEARDRALQAVAGGTVPQVGPESDIDPRKTLQQIQRKTSAAISGLMSAMQIRDELAQRVSHLHEALVEIEFADEHSNAIFGTVLSAQTEGLTDDVERVLYTITSATAATIDVVSKSIQESCGGPDNIERGEEARQVIVSAFSDNLSKGAIDDSAPWRATLTDLRRWDLPPGLPGVLGQRCALAQATMDLASATVPVMREAATQLRAAASRVPVDVEGLDLDHPVMEQLWKSYTVDAERTIQTRLIQIRQAA